MKTSILVLILFFSFKAHAQITGTNAFAKGNFIQMGVDEYGVYTAKGIPPAGFIGADTATSSFQRSFIIDKDQDGFTSGSPAYWGDYCVPGNSQEGFGMYLDGINYYNIAQYFTPENMTGSFTDFIDDGDSIHIFWEGEIPDVSYSITQETVIPKNGLYVITRLIFVNISFDFHYNTTYFRNIDPDQEKTFNGNVNTINTILSNFPADGEALAKAEGSVTGDNFLYVGSRDTRAKVSYGNFSVATLPSALDIYNGVDPFMQSGNTTSDDALQIAVQFDTILPCSAETFSFAYIFTDDPAVIDEALALTERPLYGSLCIAADTFQISDISYSNFTVSWDPDDDMEFVVKYTDMETMITETIPTTTATVSIAGLKDCTEYGVNVFSICGGDTLPADPNLTLVKTLCIDDTDAISEIDNDFSFSIFPNPSKNYFNIQTPQQISGDITLYIFDILGNLLLEENISENSSQIKTIHTSQLTNGIYNVELRMNGKIIRRKIVINK